MDEDNPPDAQSVSTLARGGRVTENDLPNQTRSILRARLVFCVLHSPAARHVAWCGWGESVTVDSRSM